jgi:membrane fusion protein (multidrug efflux system)
MKQISILLALVFILGTGSSCSSKKEQTKSERTDSTEVSSKIEKVKIIKIEPQIIGKTIEYSSSLIAFQEVNLVPSTPGRIDNILVEVGNKVAKGDLLVQMDQTQLYQASLQLKNLETDFNRLDTLQKVGSVTQQQFDQVRTQYEVAQANVKFLKENTQLRSPFDGVISGKYFENGEMYSGVPNTAAGKAAILSIVQINPLKAFVNIPETYFPQVNTGMKANVVCDIYHDRKYSGDIFRKYPVIDPASHSFQVEVKVANPGEKLRPGMFCRVTLELGQVQALVVPSLAVLKMQGSNERYVFLEKEGVAKRVTVTMGKRFDDLVEILSPEIHQGDHLIIFGQARLLDGVKVELATE